jgi:hypothetical protein
MNQSEMFDVFWSEYPRRIAKKDAIKAWMRLKITAELFDEILIAVRDQRRITWAETSINFIPYPASWLNGERWADDVPEFVELHPISRDAAPIFRSQR